LEILCGGEGEREVAHVLETPDSLLIMPPAAPDICVDASEPLDNEDATDSVARGPFWKRLGFAAVNVWLVYHLFAILVGPASVSPSSGFQQQCWLLARPYLQSLYLNHGWHYFSPEPGRSTLLSYTLRHADGSVETGRLPNRDIQPRLLYHRYFMLTEFLGNSDPAEQSLWHRAYARALCRQSGAQRVSLSRVFHDLPLAERILAGGTLDDPEFFTEEAIGSFESSEL
jgi:hypothetical protein